MVDDDTIVNDKSATLSRTQKVIIINSRLHVFGGGGDVILKLLTMCVDTTGYYVADYVLNACDKPVQFDRIKSQRTEFYNLLNILHHINPRKVRVRTVAVDEDKRLATAFNAELSSVVGLMFRKVRKNGHVPMVYMCVMKTWQGLNGDDDDEDEEEDTKEEVKRTDAKEEVKRTVTDQYGRSWVLGWNGHSNHTLFNGDVYRSRAEARFALLLQTLNIEYKFEPMTFNLPAPNASYTIDFWIPAYQVFVEIKPAFPYKEEEERCLAMSRCGFRVVLMVSDSTFEAPFDMSNAGRHGNGLRGMAWHRGKRLPGVTTFVVGAPMESNVLESVGDMSQPHLGQITNTRDMRWCHSLLTSGYANAAKLCEEMKWGVHAGVRVKDFPTTYMGIAYASQLEAMFAALLDAFCLRHCYRVVNIRDFVPTFFVPEHQLYVVLSTSYPSLVMERSCEELSTLGMRVVCMYGSTPFTLPFASECENGSRKRKMYAHKMGVVGMGWVDGVKLSGPLAFVVGAPPVPNAFEMSWVSLDKPHIGQVLSMEDNRWNHESIQSAMEQAAGNFIA